MDSLSSDDLLLWQHLSASGEPRAQKMTSADVQGSVLDLRQSINALNASTTTLTQQTRSLTLQQMMLQQLNRSQTTSRDPSQAKRDAQEARHVQIANDALCSMLSEDLRLRQDAIENEMKSIPATASARLRSDDRALDHLEEQMTKGRADHTCQELMLQVTPLLQALQARRSSALKDSLDQVYLSALLQHDHDDLHDNDTEASVQALKADIETLYTEIDDIVTMMVTQQHTTKLKSTVDNATRMQQMYTNDIMQQSAGEIEQMTNTLTTMTEHAQEMTAKREALAAMSTHLRDIQQSKALFNTAADATSDRTPAYNVGVQKPSNDTAPSQSAGIKAQVAMLKESLLSAEHDRRQALMLLQAQVPIVESSELDALDNRIASSSRIFEPV